MAAMATFRVLVKSAVIGNVGYRKGDLVESDKPLDRLFQNAFVRLSDADHISRKTGVPFKPDPNREQLIVGCYTPGDYDKEAHERLIPSVVRLGLPHTIRQIPSRGSWVLNNSACQLYLQTLDKEKPDADFLYIDVDGVVRSNPWPLLRTLDCDIAAYKLRGVELLSGTLFLPAGPKRKELLDDWVELNAQKPDVWDQQNLQYILEHSTAYRYAPLPAEFCVIYDIQRLHTPHIVPIIEHFQASRRFRNQVQPLQGKVK